MKNLIRTLALLTIIAIAACKKDTLEAPPLPEPDDVVETPIDSSHISGSFKVTSTYLIENDSLLIPIDTATQVEFYDASIGNDILINSVSVNGVPLPYDPSKLCYTTPFYINNIEVANWNLKGNSIIPDFSYINKTGMPIYKLYGSIPNMVDRTKDFVLPITGFINTDRVAVYINDHVSNGVLWSFSTKYTAVTIPVVFISQLTPSPLADIEVRFENKTYVSFNNKTFCFVNEVILCKKVLIL